MTDRKPDVLLPGQALGPGEYLESHDSRFRLYLEESGQLIAYAYPERGINRYWGSPLSAVAGPNARLELGRIPSGGGSSSPAIILRKQDGSIAWYETDRRYGNIWENLGFFMQTDGNVVLYAKSTTGVVKPIWDPPGQIYLRWRETVAYPPNEIVCVVPGDVAIDSNFGNYEIVNNSGDVLVVVGGTNVLAMEDGATIGAAVSSGVVSVEVNNYPDPRAAEGTRASRTESDNIAVSAGTGRRPSIIVGNGGFLSLRNYFVNSPVESFRELVVHGRRSGTEEVEKGRSKSG